MENENLHLLINEEIYVLKSQATSDKAASDKVQAIDKAVEKVDTVFVHQSEQAEELELLEKIIGACKLDASSYKIAKSVDGIQFSRSVVFTEKAETFYAPTDNDDSQILYSKPLATLLSSKDEKAKLWSALQEFISS